MEFQRSDILLVPFPFSDFSATKVRPAVVVSSSIYQAAEPDLILAAITSNFTLPPVRWTMSCRIGREPVCVIHQP